MTYLPDVNVWLALVAERHVHHVRARGWFDALNTDLAAFRRVTQMGFLRLITNEHVLHEDVLTPAIAWHTYETLCADSRIAFSVEPPTIEERWRVLTEAPRMSGATWTDTYLMSFANIRGMRPVSFDHAFEAYPQAVILK